MPSTFLWRSACVTFVALIGLHGCSSPAESASPRFPERDHIKPAKKGITDADIEAVLVEYGTRFSMGMSGNTSTTYEADPIVLFKGGIGCEGVSHNLINVSLKDIANEEADCFVWRKRRGQYEIKWDEEDGWEESEETRYERGRKDLRLNRVIQDFDSLGGGELTYTSHYFFKFAGGFDRDFANRVLTMDKYGLGTHFGTFDNHTSREGSVTGTSTNYYELTPADQIVDESPSGSEVAVSKSRKSRPDLTGEYYIDGHTIEFFKADGTRERQIFAISPWLSSVVVGDVFYNYLLPAYLEPFKRVLNDVNISPDESVYLARSDDEHQRIRLSAMAIQEGVGSEFPTWATKVVEKDVERQGGSVATLAHKNSPVPGVELFIQPADRRKKGAAMWVYLAFQDQRGNGYLYKVMCLDETLAKKYLPELLMAGRKLMKS